MSGDARQIVRDLLRSARRRSLATILLALAATIPLGGNARATGPLDGAWVVKLDLEQSSFVYRAQVSFGLVERSEVWVVEGQFVRAFGRNRVFRVTGRSNTDRELTAIEEWTLSIDMESKVAQNRPTVLSNVTMKLDAQGRMTIMETVSLDKRVFVGRLAGAAVLPVQPAVCTENAGQLTSLQQQLAAVQRERDQCRSDLARAAPRPPATMPAPAPAPTPGPAQDGCPAFGGAVTAIRVDGVTEVGAGRVAIALGPGDQSVTLRGRSGFLRDLIRVTIGERQGLIGACGDFAVTVRPDGTTRSMMLTTEARDGRRGTLTIDIRREP